MTDASGLRQVLLVLYTANSGADSAVTAWAWYDGSRPDVDENAGAALPYVSPLAAMRDGWRVIAIDNERRDPAAPHETTLLPYRFVLERLVDVRG